MLILLLLFAALACFALAAAGVASRVNLVAAGLAASVLAAIIFVWPG